MDSELEEVDLQTRDEDSNWPGRDKALAVPEILSPVFTPDFLRVDTSWREPPTLSVLAARAGSSDWCEHAGIALLACPAYRFRALWAALEVGEAGGGMGLAWLRLIRPALDTGTLDRISEVEFTTSLGHWITGDRKPASRESNALWVWLSSMPDRELSL